MTVIAKHQPVNRDLGEVEVLQFVQWGPSSRFKDVLLEETLDCGGRWVIGVV